MKYKIVWLEYHIIETEKELEETLSYLPPDTKHEGNVFGDEIHEFECSDFFEANDLEEAKKKASEYECGENNIFTVFDEQGEKLFTEEDL